MSDLSQNHIERSKFPSPRLFAAIVVFGAFEVFAYPVAKWIYYSQSTGVPSRHLIPWEAQLTSVRVIGWAVVGGLVASCLFHTLWRLIRGVAERREQLETLGKQFAAFCAVTFVLIAVSSLFISKDGWAERHTVGGVIAVFVSSIGFCKAVFEEIRKRDKKDVS